MRRAAEDDLEVLPVDVHATVTFGTSFDDPRVVRARRRRWPSIAALVAVVAVVAAALVVQALASLDDPARDTDTLVAAWKRALTTTAIADRASIRVRILVPTREVPTAFRGLAAVRIEERDRLRELATAVADVETRDVDVRRARDAITRAIAIRERRSRVTAAFYAAGGNGIRNLESIDRGVATTLQEVDSALERLGGRFEFARPLVTEPLAASPALARALGPFARVVDGRVGAHLLLNVDGRLVELDPDRGRTGRVTTLDRQPSLRNLTSLDGGAVLAWDANSDVRVVDTSSNWVGLSRPIGTARPLPSTRRDAAWLTTGVEVTEVGLDGTILAGPFRQPVGQVVGATPRGLLVFDPGAKGPPTVAVWSPPDGAVLPLVQGIFVGASHSRVATMTCERAAACTLHVTDVQTGTTRDVAPPGPSDWTYGTAAVSPDGRWMAVGAHSTATDSGLFFVDLRSLASHLVRTPDGPRALAWSPDAERVFAINDRGSEALWVSPTASGAHAVRFQVAFERLVRVRDLAVVAP